HDHAALAKALGTNTEAVQEACALILSLRPQPVEEAPDAPDGAIIPDVVVRHLDGAWRVAVNTRGTPRARVSAHCEAALAGARGAGVRPPGGAGRVAVTPRRALGGRLCAARGAAGAGGGGRAERRGLLEEAGWLVRGVAMRGETLLGTAKVLVGRQAGCLA